MERVNREGNLSGSRRSRAIRAVDGEASVPDKEGRQNYNLLVAGGRMLRPKLFPDYLHSVEIFEFLLSLPAEDYLVGYYIDYDATHWLRHLPQHKRDRIYIENKQLFGNYTWWKNYGVIHIPGQFFRLCRTVPNVHPPRRIDGSARTINNVSGFQRGPFLDFLATMQVGTASEIAEIRAGKEARGRIELPPAQIERYCKLECRLLAKAVTKLRGNFEACGYPLRDYRGPGAAAAAILREQPQIPKRPDKPTRPARIDVAHEQHRYPDNTQWRQAVMTAFFGGRIESRAYGDVDQSILVYDRHGSYCAGLRELPCPKHTEWVRFRGEPKDWRWYLARGTWQTADKIAWGPLPARTTAQSIIYPMSVSGYWWSPELEGLDGFKFEGGWGADKTCDCDPFDFIDEIYDERLRLGEMAGQPLKIGMAAITGRFAQHKYGLAPWRDLVIAGLTYSQTRAAVRKLLNEDTLHVATDAVYTTRPLAVKQSPALGDWQMTEIKNGLLMVQPGVLWNRDYTMLRARGFSKSTLLDHVDKLRRAWNAWNPLFPPPSVTIPVELFYGHKAAAARYPYKDNNAPTDDELTARAALTGTWKKLHLPLSFDWQSRRHTAFELHGSHIVTFAPEQHQKSVPYDPSMISEIEKMDILLTEQPDG